MPMRREREWRDVSGKMYRRHARYLPALLTMSPAVRRPAQAAVPATPATLSVYSMSRRALRALFNRALRDREKA